MPAIYVSKNADEFSEPIYHLSYHCGRVNLFDDKDTLYEVKMGRLKDTLRIPGFEKMFRACDRCG